MHGGSRESAAQLPGRQGPPSSSAQTSALVWVPVELTFRTGTPCAPWSSAMSISTWSLLDDIIPADVRDEYGGRRARAGFPSSPWDLGPIHEGPQPLTDLILLR